LNLQNLITLQLLDIVCAVSQFLKNRLIVLA